MPYPIIFNGDHIEFERQCTNVPIKDRPDWPLPSFDAQDWAEAFCSAYKKLYPDNPNPPDEAWMITWFACALMRGFDEHASRVK